MPPPLKLGICELYHPKLYGNTYSSSHNIILHYIVNSIIELDDFMTNPRLLDNVNTRQLANLDTPLCNYELELKNLARKYNKINDLNRNKCIKHPSIENYDTIIRKNDYIRVDIIETRILTGMEEVAILKTHLIRVVQRKWKRLYKSKMEKLKKKMSWYYLKRREIYGR